LAVNALAVADADRRTPFIVHVLRDVTSTRKVCAPDLTAHQIRGTPCPTLEMTRALE
jgi:hypothetical protein